MTSAPIETRARHYTVSITKGAALINEMKTLLRQWSPSEDYRVFLERIQQTGVLSKETAYRTHDLVNRVFRPRLLTPDDRAARALKLLFEAGVDNSALNELLLLYSARADDVLYDFVVRRFWPLARSGAVLMQVDAALSFLEEINRTGQVSQVWTQTTQLRIARGLLAALRDFGLLRQAKRGRREIVLYRLTAVSVAYLAHELHFAGLPDAAVAEHADWGLYGLDRAHVLDRLDLLGPRLGLLVQRAGSVVRITWSQPSMESLIHVLTR